MVSDRIYVNFLFNLMPEIHNFFGPESFRFSTIFFFNNFVFVIFLTNPEIFSTRLKHWTDVAVEFSAAKMDKTADGIQIELAVLKEVKL